MLKTVTLVCGLLADKMRNQKLGVERILILALKLANLVGEYCLHLILNLKTLNLKNLKNLFTGFGRSREPSFSTFHKRGLDGDLFLTHGHVYQKVISNVYASILLTMFLTVYLRYSQGWYLLCSAQIMLMCYSVCYTQEIGVMGMQLLH